MERMRSDAPLGSMAAVGESLSRAQRGRDRPKGCGGAHQKTGTRLKARRGVRCRGASNKLVDQPRASCPSESGKGSLGVYVMVIRRWMLIPRNPTATGMLGARQAMSQLGGFLPSQKVAGNGRTRRRPLIRNRNSRSRMGGKPIVQINGPCESDAPKRRGHQCFSSPRTRLVDGTAIKTNSPLSIEF